MRATKLLGATLAAGLGLATLAGCGSSAASNPTQAVDNALQSDLNQPGLQMVVELKGTPADFGLNAPSNHLTSVQQQAIMASHLVITVHGAGSTAIGKVSPTSGNNAVEVALVKGSDNLSDTRFIGSELYARVDIPKLTSDYQLNTGSAAKFQADLQTIASEVKAAGALASGQWISVNVPQTESLVASALHVSPSLLPQVNPGELIQIVDSVFSGLQHNSTVAAVSGSSNSYELTVKDKAMASDLSQALGSTPGFSAIPKVGTLRQQTGSIPATMTTKVTATVTNGKVSQLSLDAKQFNNTSNGQIIINITSAGSISAPSGATPVDLTQVGKLIGQMLGGSAG